jgi:hypothetical protein
MHEMSAEKIALDFINVYKKYKDRKSLYSKNEEERQSLNDSRRKKSKVERTDQEEHTS